MHFHFTGNYGRVTVDARGARRILKRRNVGRLMAAIREVNHSEELTFGRSSSRTTLRRASSCSRAARSRTATCRAAWTSSGCGNSGSGRVRVRGHRGHEGAATEDSS